MIRSIVLWWRNVTREDGVHRIGASVLITAGGDQMILGRLCSCTSGGILVDRASVGSEGKFSALPHPGTLFVPMKRVHMMQYVDNALTPDVLFNSEGVR